MRSGALFLVLLCTLFPAPTHADVFNGDFQFGEVGWSVMNPQNWITQFPTDGGNPGPYALIRSPALNSGGVGMLGQEFACGAASDGTACRIAFDYKIDFFDAASGTARIQVQVNDEIVYTGPSATTAGIPWTTVDISVEGCGLKRMYLILQVDPGNNAWWACFDNVMGACEAVPVEPTTWGIIKTQHGW